MHNVFGASIRKIQSVSSSLKEATQVTLLMETASFGKVLHEFVAKHEPFHPPYFRSEILTSPTTLHHCDASVQLRN